VRWQHRDESGRGFELQRKMGRMRKKSVFLFLEEKQKRGITSLLKKIYHHSATTLLPDMLFLIVIFGEYFHLYLPCYIW